jgi:hypothetical protein
MGRPDKDTRGRVDARRIGKSRKDPHEQRVVDMLVGALSRAGEAGVSREQVADAVGKSPRSLASYVELTGPNINCPAPVLVRLVQNGERILGADAHAWLLEQLLRPAGYGVHALCEEAERGEAVALSVLDSLARFGALSDGLREALTDGDIDEAEARRGIAHVDRVIASLQGVREQLVAEAGGGL